MPQTKGLPIELKFTFIGAMIVVLLLVFYIVFAIVVYTKKQKTLLTEKRLQEVEYEKEILAKELENIKTLQLERERISQDMHDDIGSNLSSIKLQAQLIKNNIHDQAIHADLDEILNDVSIMNASMREMIWSLQSQNDELLSFISYIRQYAHNLLNKAQITFHFTSEITEQQVLPSHIRRNLFLVVKEAVHNIVKHSEATEASLLCYFKDNFFCIKISDNGVGISEYSGTKGNGLVNMKNRILSAQGNFSINCMPNSTVILLSAPI